MGRPKKIGVDYFPHDVESRKTIYILEKEFGNDGYAVWYKTLELLGSSEGLFLDLNDDEGWAYYVAKMKVPEEIAKQILDKLALLNAIDPYLWNERVIWSDNFVSRVSDVYIKRNSEIPQKPYFHNGINLKTMNDYICWSENVNISKNDSRILIEAYGYLAFSKAVDELSNFKLKGGEATTSNDFEEIGWILERIKQSCPKIIKGGVNRWEVQSSM